MYAAKVKVAFGRHVRNIGWNLLFLAEFPYHRRRCRVVYRHQDHVSAVQIRRLKHSVDMCDLLLLDSIRNLVVETRRGTYYFDVGVCV